MMIQKYLCCLFLLLLVLSGVKRADAQKPNIIFILTDDHRREALGYAGNNIVQTPEMDKLAASGIYFKNAFVTTPICAASRASLLTGLYERTHRYTFQAGPIREEQMRFSYPKVLKENGYYTAFFGKYGVKYDDMDTLFNEHDDYDRDTKFKDRRGYFYKTLKGDTVHLTRYTGQQAVDFIDKAPKNQPFCLSLSFSAPHAHDPAPDQYYWQKEVDHLYQNINIPGPELGDDRYFTSLPLSVQKGFNRTRWAWRFDTPEKYQKSVRGYYRMITGIDLEIAKIRARLKEKGLDQNTAIVLMGDNGYFLGERQLADKWLMYDQSIGVPLIIYDPRVKRHRDITEMALNIDVPATILDLAGIKIPVSWQGKSLVPLINGSAKTLARDTILVEHLWETEDIPPSEGVRTQDWKYFRYTRDKSIEELYHLKSDSKEIKNLAKDPAYRETLLALRKKCNQLIIQFQDPFLTIPQNLTTAIFEDADVKNRVPEYSWEMPGEKGVQKAYQVLVSSSKENSENNIGDAWDSRRVTSTQATNITYQGQPLKTNETYFWKVRAWDKDNHVTEYSAQEQFVISPPKMK